MDGSFVRSPVMSPLGDDARFPITRNPPARTSKDEAMSAARKTETAVIETAPSVPTTLGEAAAVVQMIERAAADPAVDVDKMMRLLDMQERVMERRAEQAFNIALAEMQPKLPIITERGKILSKGGAVQSTYAYWEDVNEAIKPVLAEHGFSLSFRTGRDEQQRPTVTGILRHVGGHKDETTLALPVDDSGSKNGVQGIGSSTSYGKRYTAFALLNITSRGEDDDGQSGGAPAAVTAAIAAIDTCTTDAELKAWVAKNDAALKELPAAQHAAIVSAFNSRRRKLRAEAQ